MRKPKALLHKLRLWLGIPGTHYRTDAFYGVRYLQHNIPKHLPAKAVHAAMVTLENTGQMTWQADPPDGRSVALYLRFGERIMATVFLPCRQVRPGECVTFFFPIKMPAEKGSLFVQIEMVEHQVTLFRDRGVAPLTINLIVDPPLGNQQDDVWDLAHRYDPWQYQPTRGISRGRNHRRYPVVASRAKGCYLWDGDGRSYIDYIMGWGSALLGYAEDRVQQAIAEAVQSTAPTIPYVHPLEMEVAQMLAEDFPSAEMSIFGKNGSDVCTLAARLARVVTGRQTILYSGYHGWQDGWVERMGFNRSGVPSRPVPILHHFPFQDSEDFFRLYEKHRKDLAAIMLEPSGSLGQDDIGSQPDEHRHFLQTLSTAARNAGALLIFDEILTGYRYPQGSVQKATGVIPDLTCLGKALASGMPLAALGGRAEIMEKGMPNTRYAPTFKGEIYSLAAAQAAIRIYRSEPVADYVWNYGLRLRRKIEEMCRERAMAAECKGTPYRMILTFIDPDPYRLTLKKTLYMQELLSLGLSTYNGIFLPSYAHNEEVFQLTISLISRALDVLTEADRKNTFDRYLEIPPLMEFL